MYIMKNNIHLHYNIHNTLYYEKAKSPSLIEKYDLHFGGLTFFLDKIIICNKKKTELIR